ncbi:hypothetical protein D3C76_1304570 [compost metagenome]
MQRLRPLLISDLLLGKTKFFICSHFDKLIFIAYGFYIEPSSTYDKRELAPAVNCRNQFLAPFLELSY